MSRVVRKETLNKYLSLGQISDKFKIQIFVHHYGQLKERIYGQ